MIRVGFRAAPTRNVITQMTMGQFLQNEWRNPASGIETGIDDQSFPVDLGKESSVKLGDSFRVHIRNVEVTNSPFGLCFDEFQVLFDPFPVTGFSFVDQGFDNDFSF